MRLRTWLGRFHRLGTRLARRARGIERRVVRLEPPGEPVGQALLSYIVDPFLAGAEDRLPLSHTHFWESWRMGRTLVELGFAVDAIHWTNTAFLPTRSYDLVVDVRLNLERLAPLLPSGAVKVMHIETSHPAVHNPAQRRRLAALAARRGVRLAPFKMLEENRAIEHADAATILGNEVTQAGYRFAGRPLHPVPISQPLVWPFPDGKPFAECRRRFVWFGSGGMVHKGLDLVLEVFAGLPELELAVVGPVDRERAFSRAFARELERTPNITTHGWMEIADPAFRRLADRSLALVYPSCAEGQNGGAVTCMHAGLIPVLSRECGLDLADDRGVLLRDSSLDEIRSRVLELASRPPEQSAAMARRAWEWVRVHHTRERFATAWREAIVAIVRERRPDLPLRPSA
ncbi:MAG: glycosyltransferase [Thermoanaerobaculia bacterium]|nr:glycosyltransferase [Thermoanaerobaculia bacterium]